MREGWRQVKLGDVCEITKGTSPTLKAQPGRYPLIVTGPVASTSNTYQFEGEAVCVPLVSSTGHGHASLKRVHYASGKFAVANIIASCVPLPMSEVSAHFLFHLLQHHKDDLLVPRMRGTANVSLSVMSLAEVLIALPPLDEQRRIVDLIGAVDRAIEAAEDEAGRCADLLGNVRDGLFGKFERVEVGSLVDKIEGGKSVRAENRPPAPGEAGVLKVSAVSDRGFAPAEAKALATTDGFSSRMLIREGDLLITRANTAERIGMVCLAGTSVGELYLSDKTLRLSPAAGVRAEALLHALKTRLARAQLVAAGTGSSASMKNISQKDILRVKTGWPHEPDEQVRISRVLNAHSATVDAARANAEAFRNLRADLLTVLLSGDHEIPPTYDKLLESAA